MLECTGGWSDAGHRLSSAHTKGTSRPPAIWKLAACPRMPITQQPVCRWEITRHSRNGCQRARTVGVSIRHIPAARMVQFGTRRSKSVVSCRLRIGLAAGFLTTINGRRWTVPRRSSAGSQAIQCLLNGQLQRVREERFDEKLIRSITACQRGVLGASVTGDDDHHAALTAGVPPRRRNELASSLGITSEREFRHDHGR